MKKRVAIIAAMVLTLGIGGLVSAANTDNFKGLAGKLVADKHLNNNDAENDVNDNEENDNENNASANAILVQELVNEMQEAKIAAKDEMATEKAAVLEARKLLIEARKTKDADKIIDAENDLNDVIEAYKLAKADMQTSVGELKKDGAANNGLDKGNKENKGHQNMDLDEAEELEE
ncbi:MAG: hypothetical protein AB9844_12480 [Clostridiaceae bacterium]